MEAAGATFGSVYYPIVTLYQLVLAALILRGGRLDAVRGGVGLVLLVNALETYSYAAQPYGWHLFPYASEDMYRFDGILVLTLPLLASQIPRPLGGARGARRALALWLVAVAVWVATWLFVELPFPARDWVRVLGSPGGLVLASGILALHTVPAVVRLPPGPLRVQSMLLAAGLALGLADSGGYALGFGATRLGETGLPAHEHAATAALLLMGYFALLLGLQAARGARGARDAWALAAGVALMVPMGWVDYATPLDSNEFIHQAVRPLLVGIALLRYDFVQVPRGLRRPLAAATAILMVLALFLLLAVTLAGADVRTTSQVGPLPVAVAAALVALGAFALRSTFEELFPVTAPTDAAETAARMERYRLALERRRQTGGDGGDDAELAQVRRSLGISAAQHQALAALLARNVVIPSAALLGAQPGMVIGGRFQVERLLGQGGQGRALLAREVASGRQVVLKEALRPWEADAADRRASLRREAAAARRVSSPHLARIEDVVEEAWQTYLVREYVPGETLGEAVARRGPLPLADVAALARGLLAGLGALHGAGLACHDVKPGNVVLADGGRAVIIDQGTARLTGAGEDATLGRVAGSDPFTARWAAPEQLRGAPEGARTDVYQAAALLAYALTGEAPEPGRKLSASVPAAWRAALTRALAREPEKRFEDAASFQVALAPALRPPAEEPHSR